MSFANRLKQAMDEREMSQTELSALTEIGKSSISQYLSGKNVPKEKVKAKIAAALDCSIDFLDDKTAENDHTANGLHNVPVAVAAKRLDKSEQFVRVSLQTGKAPFGFAAMNKTKWSYHISPKKLDDYIGANA